MQPKFPEFKSFELRDRDFIQEILNNYQPQTSEWTFTNLFIWRNHYQFQWTTYQNNLIVLCANKGFYFLPTIGLNSRLELIRLLLKWLKNEKGEKEPRIEKVDQRLKKEIEEAKDLLVEPTRDQFDYVYRTEDLIKLAGRKFHRKKNHVNSFLKMYKFEYKSLSENYIKECFELTEKWCKLFRCEEDMNLLDELEAIREALTNFSALKIQGGVILIDNKVEAFTLGELLNNQTAVVHIEKANPEIKGAYAIINQQFCEKAWHNDPYINREQDLGEPGLRQAKLSYNPNHLVEKYSIKLADKSE
jgi:uncharacterized protein